MQNFVFMLLSIFLYYIAFVNLSKIKFSVLELISAIIISEVVCFTIFQIPKAEMFSSLAITIIMMVFAYKKNKSISLSIVFAIMGTLLALATGNISSVILNHLFRSFAPQIRSSWSLYIFGISIAYIICFLIAKPLGNFIDSKLKLLDYKLQNRLAAYIIYGSVVILAQFYTNLFMPQIITDEAIIETINTVGLILLLFLLIFSVYSLIMNERNRVEISHKQDLLDNLKSYTDSIENMYTDTRKFQHDHVNILSALYGYIEGRDLDGMENYFTANIVPINQKIADRNTTLDRLKNIHIPELKGLLSLKFLHAMELNIETSIELDEGVNTIDLDMVDLCRIVGIIVDNAIEGSLLTVKPVIKFAITQSGGTTWIILKNSCMDAVPPISKMFEHGFSTKGDNRGMGLSTLKYLLDTSGNAGMKIEAKDGEFVLIVTIERKVSKMRGVFGA